jgi:hypothetical protein
VFDDDKAKDGRFVKVALGYGTSGPCKVELEETLGPVIEGGWCRSIWTVKWICHHDTSSETYDSYNEAVDALRQYLPYRSQENDG